MFRWSGLIAGSAMLLAGFVVLWFTSYTFAPPAAIMGGVEPGSPAAQAGLISGDAIAAVNGREISNFTEFLEIAGSAQVGEPLYLTLYREGTALDRRTLIRPAPLPHEDPDSLYWTGIDPPHRAVIGAVAPRNPADLAGLLPGDVILSAGGAPVDFFSQLAQITAAASGPIDLKVRRVGREFTVTVTPMDVELKTAAGEPFLDRNGQPIRKKIIGVALDPSRYLYSPVTRFSSAAEAISSTIRAPRHTITALTLLAGGISGDPLQDRTAALFRSIGTLVACLGWLTLAAGVGIVFWLKPEKPAS